MAADERRVEARLNLMGRGLGATPELIQELERRAAKMQRLYRKPPAQAFAAVLDDQAQAAGRGEAAPAATKKERRRQALPAKGPRPGLTHPEQKSQFGRDAPAQGGDAVVLKG